MENPKVPERSNEKTDVHRSKRILFWLVVVVLALNGALLYKVLAPAEPTYQGKTVGQWCEAINLGKLDPEVVNAFGVKAAPHLVRTLSRTKTPLNQFFWALHRRLPKSLRARLPFLRPIDVVGTTGTAQEWLIQLGPDAKIVVPELITMALHGRNQQARYSGVMLLGFVGTESSEALPVLVNLLKDQDVVIQDQAALAIGRFGSKAKPAVPALVQFLKNHPQGKPFNPILALGAIGPEAREAVPEIVAAMSDKELELNCFHALANIGSGAAAVVPALIIASHHPNCDFQLLALETLMKIDPPARSALPALRELQTNSVDSVRILAHVAIAKIEGQPESAMPVLLAELRSENPGEKGNWLLRFSHPTWPYRISFGVLGPDAAGWFLGQIGPRATEALPTLRQFMKDGRLWRRVVAASSAWRIGRNAGEVLPVLLAGLAAGNNEDDFPFHVALQTLTEMGSAARPAAPALSRFINQTTNRWIARREVWHVLQKIDAEAAAKAPLH